MELRCGGWLPYLCCRLDCAIKSISAAKMQREFCKKNEELDREKDNFQFTGYEPWVQGFYSQFDLLKELSLEILENVKFRGGNLFRWLV